MKIMTALLALSFSLNAFATTTLDENTSVLVLEQDVEASSDQSPIDVNGPIRVLGSGVMNSSSGESIALVCVGSSGEAAVEPTCELARFGSFKPSTEQVTLMGPTFRIPTAPSDKLRTKAMRVVVREFFDTHMTSEQKHNRYLWSRQIPTYASAGVLVVGLFTLPAVGIVGGASLGIYLLLSGSGTADFLSSNFINGTPVSFTAQQGWNWSSRPSSVSVKKFEGMMAAIVSGDSKGVQEHLPKYMERNQRARKRLESKGVQF